jgi:hypothetical protein
VFESPLKDSTPVEDSQVRVSQKPASDATTAISESTLRPMAYFKQDLPSTAETSRLIPRFVETITMDEFRLYANETSHTLRANYFFSADYYYRTFDGRVDFLDREMNLGYEISAESFDHEMESGRG